MAHLVCSLVVTSMLLLPPALAGQDAPNAIDSVASTKQKLYVLDPTTQKIWTSKSGDFPKDAQALIAPSLIPTSLSSDGRDAFALSSSSIYKLAPTGPVKVMDLGSDFQASEWRMKAVLSSSSGESHFFLTNREGTCIESVSSSSLPSQGPSKNCELGTIQDVAVDGSRLLLASGSDSVRYLDAGTLKPMGNTDAISRSSTLGLRKGDFFSHVTDVSALTASKGIVYGLSRDKLYTLLDGDPTRGILLHPPHAPPLKTNSFQSLSVTGDRILISDPSKAEVISLDRLVPISVEINVEKNTSDSMGALYKYLLERDLIPTETVSIPYKYKLPDGKDGTCTSPMCIVRARRLVLSGWVFPMEDVLCALNSSHCRGGKWKYLLAGDTLLMPLIPYESYLGVVNRALDGKSTVRATIEDQFDRSKEDLDEWNKVISNETLGFLNPKFAKTDILNSHIKTTSFEIPAVLYRYYISLPNADLHNVDSDFWRLINRINSHRKVLSVASLETKDGTDAGIAHIETSPIQATETQAVVDASSLALNEDQLNQYMSVDDQAFLAAPKPNHIILYEDQPDCKHPVFFANSVAHPNAFEDRTDCPYQELQWTHMTTKDLPLNYHSTCIASLLGARMLPYSKKAITSQFLLRSVPKKQQSLDDAIRDAMWRARQSVVNVSQAEYDERVDGLVAKAWMQTLDSEPARHVLFVIAAGDHGHPIGPDNNPYPATLTLNRSNAISVAALNSAGNDLWQATPKVGADYGTGIELASPGQAIPCAVGIDGSSALYSLTDGSSMSAAIVADVAAKLMEQQLKPSIIKGRLLASSDDVASLRDKVVAGRLNVHRALLDKDKAHIWIETPDTLIGPASQPSADGTLLPRNDYEITIFSNVHTRTQISMLDVLRIERTSPAGVDPALYRVVYRDSNLESSKNPWTVKRDQHIEGCLFYQLDGQPNPFLVRFERCNPSDVGDFTNIVGFKDYLGPILENN